MPRGRRRVLLFVGIGIVIFLILFTAFAGFYVDLLWYQEVGFSSVFWKTLGTKAFLGVVFGVVFFGMLYVNLLFVRQLKAPFRPVSAEQEIIERYRLSLEPSLRWLLPLIAAVIALFVGIAAASQWPTFLLWRSAEGLSFQTVDPELGRDPAFYVFSLPWLKFVQSWLFSSLLGVTILTAIAHYLWGGIRPQAPQFADKVTPQVKAHLSVLLGLVILVKAWGYWLGRYDLLVSERGVVTGASYTDVKAQMPALALLTVIAIVCAILFLVNIRFKGWALPVIGVGLLALVSIVAGAVIPAAVQRLSVSPQELQRERPYIGRNIKATRTAFDLDRIQLTQRDIADSAGPDVVEANAATVSNIRLWRPDVLLRNFKSLQRIRQYYEFHDIDVDRYLVDGELRVAMVSAREISQSGIPGGGTTWQNQHLVYTHGYGGVASRVNTATVEGAPVFLSQDIPPVTAEGAESLSLTPPTGEPRVYYGEAEEDVPFVVVGTGARELDYEGAVGGEQTFRYDGEGGIPMGNFLKRAVFAYRYRDVNLLISGLIDGDSRIMIYRNIRERASRAAPFLQFDGDPYAAIVDGRIKWIWDAYTTSNAYPYSEEVDLAAATQGAMAGTANYIRNSVKIVVDAYDGTMNYYVTDSGDPIIRAWQAAFPDLLTPESEIPPSLKEHFRYPENLFMIQAEKWANYHVTDPEVFYQKQDFWAVPVDPTAVEEGSDPTVSATGTLRPNYVLMRLPDEDQETFALIMPFTPQGRQNVVAWMAAKSDPTDYGELVSYRFPATRNVDGPQQVFARINQDVQFSQDRTLLSQGGSDVLFGDFLVIPIADSLLYVQPVYVASDSPDQTLPVELKRVIVVNGGRVGIGENLEDALTDSFLGQIPEQPGDGQQPGGGGNVEQRIQQLIADALEAFQTADEALQDGDLATYQEQVERARGLIAQAEALAERARGQAGQSGDGTAPTESPTPSPEPAASPTASPTT
jgi:uncharacterized protein